MESPSEFWQERTSVTKASYLLISKKLKKLCVIYALFDHIIGNRIVIEIYYAHYIAFISYCYKLPASYLR